MKSRKENPFGYQMRLYREHIGMTQEKLAEKIQRDQAWVSQLETGHRNNPTLDSMLLIANALGASIDEILLFDEKA